MELQTLQDTNQLVHVQIPEVNLCERISFGHFRTFPAAGGRSSGFFVQYRSVSAKEGVPRPAQVGEERGNWDAGKVAPRVGNG
jgi:hypothetical protein